MTTDTTLKPTARRYSPELKDRAVRMVLKLREETGKRNGTVKRVADQLDIGVESLRSWVRGGTPLGRDRRWRSVGHEYR